MQAWICKQAAADTAHLLIVKHASAKKPDSDIQYGNGDYEQQSIQNIWGDIQPKANCGYITNHALRHGNGDNGQSIAENKIQRGERRGISKALLLSRAMIVAENKVIKESPKTVIPGVKCCISKRLTGILA